MKTVGLITEYNPFHNGHNYHIEMAKKTTGADYAVVIMSGNFVQRGTPAMIDKYSRTKMALHGGSDLVIELPVCYSTASANIFATGAVSILNALGMIDYLCFGSECGDIESLYALSEMLSNETEQYKALLKEYLKAGWSFPKSRALAIGKIASEQSLIHTLEQPNNMLGIEYITAIRSIKSSMIPVTITRMDSGYHSLEMKDTFCSASAIRQNIFGGYNDIKTGMPEFAYYMIDDLSGKNALLTEDDFSLLLGERLLSLDKAQINCYADISKDLANRIFNHSKDFETFSQFAMKIKSKDQTLSHINRSLLHIMLGITKEEYNEYRGYLGYRGYEGYQGYQGYEGYQRYPSHGTAYYARLLGFRKNSARLLNHVKENASIPLISKLADYKRTINGFMYPNPLQKDTAVRMLERNIYADHLYRLVLMNKTRTVLPNEYSNKVIIHSG